MYYLKKQMKKLLNILVVVSFFILNAIISPITAQNNTSNDSISHVFEQANYLKIDSLTLDSLALNDSIVLDSLRPYKSPFTYVLLKPTISLEDTISFVSPDTFKLRVDSLMALPISRYEESLYSSNMLFLPLVYNPRTYEPLWSGEMNFSEMLYGKYEDTLKVLNFEDKSREELVLEMREKIKANISTQALDLFVTTFDQLPKLSSFMTRRVRGKSASELYVPESKLDIGKPKVELDDIDKMYWIKKANAILQFSQNHVSANWHQGGNSNLAFLYIVQGEINYDNQKNTIWENKLEWRMGFNKIQSEKALRNLNINDDRIRFNTKLGIKAGGNWYYSVSGEAITQLFDNYKAFDSRELKARIFTPVRVNLGLGMDFKYKKKLSVMFAPLSFKYIYLQDTDSVNPNLFGLQKGQNQLKEFGSSIRANANLKLLNNWNVDSRLTFYTNYKKVEIDWNIVNNFVVNRFLTTRLELNPRFDNTIILKEGKKSRIQFKELLSVGFSFRFI